LFRGYCSNCHTLRAAGATGHLGPDLDKLKPSYAQVVTQLITGGTGGAGLPPADLTFGPGIHTFTESDMRDIAAFVFISTHK
jgi:mono/diheme cytochrome c family protein